MASSFRDPSGFIFSMDGCIYRQVNDVYRPNYKHLMESGLYKSLVDAGLLISHEEVNINSAETSKAYRYLKPCQIEFISYPSERILYLMTKE